MFTDLPSNNTLNQIDQTIKRLVEDFFICQRPPHSKVKDGGGLGVTRMMVRSRGDPPLKTLVLGDRENAARGLAQRMIVQWPASPNIIDLWKKWKKGSYVDEYANQPIQGKGIKTCKNSPLSNNWIKTDILMPGEVIDLLKMRSLYVCNEKCSCKTAPACTSARFAMSNVPVKRETTSV